MHMYLVLHCETYLQMEEETVEISYFMVQQIQKKRLYLICHYCFWSIY